MNEPLGPLDGPVPLDTWMSALEGVPGTAVVFDEDGDVAIYAAFTPPRFEPTGNEVVDRIRRQALLYDCCPHTKERPYVISRNQLASPGEAADWMAHVGQKRWGQSALQGLAARIKEIAASAAGAAAPPAAAVDEVTLGKIAEALLRQEVAMVAQPTIDPVAGVRVALQFYNGVSVDAFVPVGSGGEVQRLPVNLERLAVACRPPIT